MALPWSFMWRHLRDHPELLESGYDAAYASIELRRGWIGVPIYVAATIVSLIQPLLALALYAAIAALYAVTSQGALAPRPGADPSGTADGGRR
jgi:hypothetical protein